MISRLPVSVGSGLCAGSVIGSLVDVLGGFGFLIVVGVL
jgi:hypothetical protein